MKFRKMVKDRYRIILADANREDEKNIIVLESPFRSAAYLAFTDIMDRHPTARYEIWTNREYGFTEKKFINVTSQVMKDKGEY